MMEERWVALTSALIFSLCAVTAARKGDRPKYLTAYACEGGRLQISCDEGYLIHLIRANYGRFSISICNEHGSLDWSVDCTSHRSYYVIYESCAMKSSCNLPAASGVFGDPCPGTLKYLEAHYKCVPESMTTTSSTTTTTTIATTSMMTRPPIIIPLTRYHRPTPQSDLKVEDVTATTITTPTAEWSMAVVADQATKTSGSPPVSQSTTSTDAAGVSLSFYTQFHSSTTEVVPQKPESTTQQNMNSKEFCPPEIYRNLSWSWTKAGSVVVQKCPGGTVGEARWRCGTTPIKWTPETPDLSQCSSLWVDNLRTRVDSGVSVVNIAAELAVVTHRKPLYGGDVRYATEIVQRLIAKMSDKMQEIADDKQRHQVLQELLESIVVVANNLLEVSQTSSWEDLPASERRRVASSLLESLEHSGWLLASGQRGAFYFRKSYNQVLFSVRVVEAWVVSEVKFPSAEDVSGTSWESLEDSVHLPTQALLGTASNGVVKMVFAAYNRVEDFLGTVSSNRRGILNNSSHIINSRVIAATTGRYPAIKLAEPVTISFRIIQQENVSNPQCVYWDLDTRLWSVEGCWLRNANLTHAVCACDHLTNFALLMEVKASKPTFHNFLLLRIIVFVSCAIAMILATLTALLLQMLSFPNDHSTIHKHLCVCLLLAEVVFVAGIDQTEHTVICAFLAGTLHLLLQAVFVWLFLVTFQLYILLLGPAYSSHAKVRCFCGVAYGMPVIIVLVSAITDPGSYGTSDYCFLRFDNYHVFSFVGPAISCVLGAVMFLGLTLCRTCWFSTKSSAKHKELVNANIAKTRSRDAWLVLLSSSSAWTFLLLYLDHQTPVIAYLLTALNCLQGLAIFICFGLRNEEVRQAYRKWRDRWSGSSRNQQQPKNEDHQPGQFVLPTTSSQHIVGPPCIHSSTTVSSLSTVTTPVTTPEFNQGSPRASHRFHPPDLCHTRSPIYCHAEQLVT